MSRTIDCVMQVRKQDEKKVLEAKMKQLSLQAQRIEKEQRFAYTYLTHNPLHWWTQHLYTLSIHLVRWEVSKWLMYRK